MIVPVFKTGGWHLTVSPVGSTPTRFRQFSVNGLHVLSYTCQTQSEIQRRDTLLCEGRTFSLVRMICVMDLTHF